MTVIELENWAMACKYSGYNFHILVREGVCLLQASYLAEDITSGLFTEQHTRKWIISEHMTKSEFVQTVFKCVMTSMEHRVREGFKYKGKRVFGPHFDVDALHSICKAEHLDYRSEA